MNRHIPEALRLECFPPLPASVAQPADAADDYLISLVADIPSGIIINDRFGALSCALPDWALYSDSASALRSISHNLTRNNLPGIEHRLCSLLSDAGSVQAAIIKIPKNHEQLHHWLNMLAQHAPEADIWLAGMAKHIPVALLKWLEAHSGQYTQLPISRKARAIRIRDWKAPALQEWVGYSAGENLTINALPGVFCRHQMDIGARAFIDVLKTLPVPGPILDLGCGNGLLSLLLKQRHPQAEVWAVDDSRAAVESARLNARQNGLSITVQQSDVLSAVDCRFRSIVCNPPFHDGHVQLTNIAARMFEDSYHHLTTDGYLYVVANRHLPYQPLLKRRFRSVTTRSAGAKFVVYLCQRQ